MNHIKKWIIGILMFVLLLQPAYSLAAAFVENSYGMDSTTHVVFKPENYLLQINNNDSHKTIQTQGFIQSGLLMIPVTDLLNNTGFTVKKLHGWKGEYQAERKEKLPNTIFNNLKFTPFSPIFYLNLNEGFNGESQEELLFLPTYANSTHGRLYVPLKFLASILNYDVKYDKVTHTIVLDEWGNQNAVDIQQVKEFVNRYMNGALNGYSPDRSLYTAGFLEHENSRINDTFANDQWSSPRLVLKNGNIRHLFFVSHDRAFVKIPYEEEGKISRTVGGMWLDLLRIDGKWKVDVSTIWSQPIYIDNIDQKIKELEVNDSEKITAIKQALQATFDNANAKHLTVDGYESYYKTYLKNVEVLYTDDDIAYVRPTYNWSFKQTEDNFEKYNISSDKDFIIMEQNSDGNWVYKGQHYSDLDTPEIGTTIRGNYNGGPSIRPTAFDDYYLDNPNVKSSISFSE